MAHEDMKHRAIAAGLGGAIALAVPAVGLGVIRPAMAGVPVADTGFVPFTVGVLSGVALTGLVSYFAMRAQEQGWEAELADRGAQEPAAAASREVEAEETASAADGSHSAGFSRFKRHRDDGVPVIARAPGALSEEEAWAEIDAELSRNPSISCDPVRSKDIYELAFAELSHASESPVEGGAGEGPSMPDEGLAEFLEPISMETRSVDEVLAGRMPEFTAESTVEEEEVPQADYSGHEDMWAAALAVLADGSEADAAVADSEAVPASAEAVPVVAGTAAPTGVSTSVPASAEDTAVFVAARQASISASDAFSSTDATRPAAVLSAESLTVPAGAGVVYVPVHAVPVAYVPTHARARHESLEVQERVNELIEEEFEKSNSRSARATSRKYLSVVNGGTASLPRVESL